ncbi:thioredoxin-disulfide reductase [Elusimicrobiota bacterium]
MADKKDVVIIGGGPAGMTSAIYTARSGMETLVIEKARPGGQLWLTENIENYPGFPEGISSFKLAEMMEKQAVKFGVTFLSEEVTGVASVEGDFVISFMSGNKIEARGVIIASGASMKKLGVKGEKEFTGKGVSYCAICDGPLFKDKTVAVIGGGNTACQEALYLTRFASKVYLIHRRPMLRAVSSLRNKIESNPKIELLMKREIEEISGDNYAKALVFKNKETLDINGIFIFVGLEPNTGFINKSVKTEEGFLVTGMRYMTHIEGVYAAGDCRMGALRQVVSACGEGAAAGERCREYVEKKKGTSYDW